MRIVSWFILSALLTATFLATTTAAVAQDASSQSPTNAPLISAAQFRKINLLKAASGTQQHLDLNLVKRLGLPETIVQQIGIEDPDSNPDTHTHDTHVYTKISDGSMLFSLVSTKAAYTYHVDANLRLMNSVAMRNYVPDDISDPKSGLKKELAWWAYFARYLDDSGNIKDTDSSSPTNSPTK